MSTEDKKPIDDNEPDKSPEEVPDKTGAESTDPTDGVESAEQARVSGDLPAESGEQQEDERASEEEREVDAEEEQTPDEPEQPAAQEEGESAEAIEEAVETPPAAEPEDDVAEPVQKKVEEPLNEGEESEQAEVEAKEQPPRKKGFFRSWTFRILLVIAVFLLAVRLGLPVGIKLYAQKWLEENGADSAKIERVRLSPFAGIAALEGVDIVKDGKTVISDSTIFANLGMRSLLTRKILLQEAVLEDVVLDLEKNEDGSFRIGSYTIPVKADDAGPTSQEAVTEQKDQPAWVFFSSVIEIKNVTVRYKQPALDVELIIEEGLIEKIDTIADDITGTVKLKGTINGAPISVDLSKLDILPAVAVEGEVIIADFDLNELGELLAEVLDPFAGKAGIDGSVKFAMDGSDIAAAYEGSISLDEAEIAGSGWGTAGTLSYDGKLSYDMKLPEIAIEVDGDLRAQNYAYDMPAPLIDLDNSDILISGNTRVNIAAGVEVESTASLTLAPTTYVMEGMKAGAGDTSWQGQILFNTATQDKPLVVKLDGQFSMAEPSYSLMQEKGEMAVGNNLISWDGKIEYGLNQGDEAGSYVKTDGVLLAKETFYKQPETVEVNQAELKLTGTTDVGLGNEIAVKYSGDFDLGKTDLVMGDMAVGKESVSWKGDISYTLQEAAQLIGLKGAFNLSGLAFAVSSSGLQVKKQGLALTPDLVLTLAEKPLFAGKAGLEANGLEVALHDIPLFTMADMAVADLREDGKGGIVAGALSFNGLAVPASAVVPVGVDIAGISVNGIASTDLMSATVEGVTIDKPTIKDKSGNTLIAGLAGVKASAVSVAENLAVSVGKVEFDESTFLQEQGKDAAASLKNLAVEKLDYSKEGGLVIEAVVLDSIFAQYMREKTQETEVQAEAQPQGGAKEEKEVAAGGADAGEVAAGGADAGEVAAGDTDAGEVAAGGAEAREATPLPVKINRIDVVGTNGLKFADTTLARPYVTLFDLQTLEVRDIDLNTPEKPFTYRLVGFFDKYVPLEITGEIAPLAKDLMMSQELTLRNYSMLHISPYTVDAIGTYFPSGIADLTSSLTIGEGMIDMQNNMVIKNIVAQSVGGELAAELDNQLPVPLGLALSMLEDSNGIIDLDIPVQGELADMNVGIWDLIWTPISKSITVAVTPYLAYTALGPAGAITYFGAKLGGKMLTAEIPVLEFEKGSTELTDKHKKELEKAAKIINKELEKAAKSEEEVDFTICARVSVYELTTASDIKELNWELENNIKIRKELFNLGEKRSLAVKDHLMQAYEVPDEKLLICDPGLIFEEKKKPLIEFYR